MPSEYLTRPYPCLSINGYHHFLYECITRYYVCLSISRAATDSHDRPKLGQSKLKPKPGHCLSITGAVTDSLDRPNLERSKLKPKPGQSQLKQS